MRFKNLDLNLLVALASLLRTQSVSETARQLHLSQPAMSNALSRLREYFSDDLLVPVGRSMKPTAYAEALMPMVARIIEGVEGLIATSSQFDPVSSTRTFRLGTSDYVALVLLVPLMRRLAVEAPGVRIEIEPATESLIPRLEDGRIDLILTPDEFVSTDHPAELLFEERHVVVGWSDNPIFDRPLTEAAFLEHGHVVVEIGRDRAAPYGERQLARLSGPRRIEAVAPSFTMVPWMLVGTSRLAVMHERLATSMTSVLPLRSAPLPFHFPLMREMIQGHRARSSDAGIAWLKARLLKAARSPAIEDANGDV